VTPDEFKDISYAKDDNGIVTLTFNTPKRKNALSLYSFFEIYIAIDHFEQDNAAHAMIITGAKDPDSSDASKEAYSSGGYFNPDAYDGLSDDIMQKLDQSDIAQKRTTLKMFQCDKPIIAAVNGLCIGGAFTLTLAGADQIFMSENAWVQLPFAKLGVSAELASSFLLPRLMGLQKAKEIVFYAERIGAEQAQQLQLVNKVLPHEDLLPYAYEKALQLIPPQGAGLAIREMKKLLNEPLVEDVSQALDRENLALRKLFASKDFAEGFTARIERRPPVFQGA
jgi:enoyl-CoA hydratase/carnithine racemase